MGEELIHVHMNRWTDEASTQVKQAAVRVMRQRTMHF